MYINKYKKYIMNSEPSIRTISVKYTVVFCVIIGFLFLFSQILDNLFYDYTVIETEIVFIKRVGIFIITNTRLNE